MLLLSLEDRNKAEAKMAGIRGSRSPSNSYNSVHPVRKSLDADESDANISRPSRDSTSVICAKVNYLSFAYRWQKQLD